MYVKNSEYLSKYTGIEIDEAIGQMHDIEGEIGKGTVTFVQAGVVKGSINVNQHEDGTVDLSGGSLSGLDDVVVEDLENGQTLVYDSENQEWKNGNTSSVVFIDW